MSLCVPRVHYDSFQWHEGPDRHASIRNHADQIAKHLKNIRSFQPNALQQAKHRPTRIKKNVEKLIFDVNAFSNMENKALGKAKALITLVKFIRILASD